MVLGFRVWCLGLGVWGLGLRGLGFRGLGVKGFRVRVRGHRCQCRGFIMSDIYLESLYSNL